MGKEIKTVDGLIAVVHEIGASMNDIIESNDTGKPLGVIKLERIMRRIAAEIETLRAENKDLRAAVKELVRALKPFTNCENPKSCPTPPDIELSPKPCGRCAACCAAELIEKYKNKSGALPEKEK